MPGIPCPNIPFFYPLLPIVVNNISWTEEQKNYNPFATDCRILLNYFHIFGFYP